MGKYEYDTSFVNNVLHLTEDEKRRLKRAFGKSLSKARYEELVTFFTIADYKGKWTEKLEAEWFVAGAICTFSADRKKPFDKTIDYKTDITLESRLRILYNLPEVKFNRERILHPMKHRLTKNGALEKELASVMSAAESHGVSLKDVSWQKVLSELKRWNDKSISGVTSRWMYTILSPNQTDEDKKTDTEKVM